MALYIENEEVERLVDEVAGISGETETEAVRRALEERLARLASDVARTKRQRRMDFLEHEVWPTIPAEKLGRRLTKAEEEEILGYGDTKA